MRASREESLAVGSTRWRRGRHRLFGLAPKSPMGGDACIVHRKNRFYVVAYNGTDPTTGRERRRWHAAAQCRAEAEAIAHRLEAVVAAHHLVVVEKLTFGRYLTCLPSGCC